MRLLEVNECIDGEAQLGHGQGEYDAKQDAVGRTGMSIVVKLTNEESAGSTHGICQLIPRELSSGRSALCCRDLPSMFSLVTAGHQLGEMLVCFPYLGSRRGVARRTGPVGGAQDADR